MQKRQPAIQTYIVSIRKIVIAISLLFIAWWPAEALETDPETLISTFHAVLIDSMKAADKVDVTGRYERLELAVSNAFHLRVMVQIATGSHWRKASDEEKNTLAAAFTRLTVATYASQFDGFSGQSFETLGKRSGPQKTTLVDTRLENPNGRSVDLVYVTRKFDGKWRIVDVLLDTGISELARKRSEYRQVLKSSGVGGLVNSLNAKTDGLLSGN